MADYALTLYQSAKAGTPVFYGDITAAAQNWQRSIAAQGGALDGSFRIVGPLHQLQGWFYNRLGWHVEEVAGGKTWAGLVYEMDLTYLGSTRRRSLDNVYNYVKTHYEDGGTPADTTVAQDAGSIARYGRRENILSLTDYPLAAANQIRDLHLRQHAVPQPLALTASVTQGESYLDVTVMGYWKTMSWRYSSIQTGTTTDVSAYVNSLVTADCTDYLTVGAIRANTVRVKNSTTDPQRVWDVLQELVALGGNRSSVAYPWRLYVDNSRRVWYEEINTTPMYAIRDDGIHSYAGGGRVSPRQVVPGVMRDMRYPVVRVEAGSWLADARDTWVERVTVDADGKPRLTTSLYDQTEILQAEMSYQYEQERSAREELDRQIAKQRADEAANWVAAGKRKQELWNQIPETQRNQDWRWNGNGWQLGGGYSQG